jgi:hypothetical protein
VRKLEAFSGQGETIDVVILSATIRYRAFASSFGVGARLSVRRSVFTRSRPPFGASR